MTKKNLPDGYRPWDEIRELASLVLLEIKDSCERSDIVGDIRRHRSAKSVDILCIPKMIDLKTDLLSFGPVRVESFINTVNKWEKLKGDPVEGKYTQRWHPLDVVVNLYMATNDNYGLMMMFRTGPTEYSKRMINKETKANGMKSEGGYLRWIQNNEIIPVPTEEEFYRLVQEPWIKSVFRIK